MEDEDTYIAKLRQEFRDSINRARRLIASAKVQFGNLPGPSDPPIDQSRKPINADDMQETDTLASQALNLADGSDIHAVAGTVAVYRSLIRDGLDASELERELRSFVARKRQERFYLCAPGQS
jgi:hypothetical protein